MTMTIPYSKEHPALKAAQYWTLAERRTFAKQNPRVWAQMLPHMAAHPVERPLPPGIHEQVAELSLRNKQLERELKAANAICYEQENLISTLQEIVDKYKQQPILPANKRYNKGACMVAIKRAFCEANCIGVKEIDGPYRERRISDVRQAMFWYLREYTALSFPAIGRFVGGKDHSTVIHAWNKVKDDMDYFSEIIELADDWMRERGELPVDRKKELDAIAA